MSFCLQVSDAVEKQNAPDFILFRVNLFKEKLLSFLQRMKRSSKL